MNRPTRWARAIAFLVDGGVATPALTYFVWMIEYVLPRLTFFGPPKVVPKSGDTALVVLYLSLAGLLASLELFQRGRHLRGSPSMGFAVTNLTFREAPRHPALRRALRTSMLVCALVGLAVSWLPGLPGGLVAWRTHAFPASFAVLCLALGLDVVDAIRTLITPAQRTIGDALAGTHVIAGEPSAHALRRALAVAAWMQIAAAALYTVLAVSRVAAPNAPQSVSSEFPWVSSQWCWASYAHVIAVIANAGSIASVYEATRSTVGDHRRPALLVGVLATLPVASAVVVHRFLRRAAGAFEHDALRVARRRIDVALIVHGIAGLLVLASVAGGSVSYVLHESETLFCLTVATFASAAALRTLSEIDLRSFLHVARAEIEGVFA